MKEVEVEEGVTSWLLDLSFDDFTVVDRHIDLLAEFGHSLRMPHSRNLGDDLHELRFTLSRRAWRITYWFASSEFIVLLTVFHKQRNNERQEVEKARQALKQCQQDHL